MQLAQPVRRHWLVEKLIGVEHVSSVVRDLRDATLEDTWCGLNALVQYVEPDGTIKTERIVDPVRQITATESEEYTHPRVRIVQRHVSHGLIPLVISLGKKESIAKRYELELPKGSELYMLKQQYHKDLVE